MVQIYNISKVRYQHMHYQDYPLTYVDKNDPWTGILAAAVFVIRSTTNRQKGQIPGQLIFGYDMILPIKHTVDWELIIQRNHTQTNQDSISENRHRVDHDYKVGDNAMLTKHTVYPFLITQCLPLAQQNYSMLKQQLGIIYVCIKP